MQAPAGQSNDVASRRVIRLAGAAGSAAAAAAIGSLGARDAAAIYPRLRRPRWAPPAGAFGPVWSLLYVLIAAAGWRLAAVRAPRLALALHGVQLALNAVWPAVFFRAGSRRAALAVVGALDAALAAEVAVAARRDRPAALLLAPYLAWCAYASALTLAVSAPEASG